MALFSIPPRRRTTRNAPRDASRGDKTSAMEFEARLSVRATCAPLADFFPAGAQAIRTCAVRAGGRRSGLRNLERPFSGFGLFRNTGSHRLGRPGVLGLPRRGSEAARNSTLNRSTPRCLPSPSTPPARRRSPWPAPPSRRSGPSTVSSTACGSTHRRPPPRVGSAHVKHGMTAVSKLAIEDEPLELAQRRRHRFGALAKLDERLFDRVLGKAGLDEPRPKVRIVPSIESDLDHVMIVENVLQPLGDVLVRDRSAGRRFEISLRGPQIIGRVVAGRLFRQPLLGSQKYGRICQIPSFASQWARTMAVRSPLSERSRPPKTLGRSCRAARRRRPPKRRARGTASRIRPADSERGCDTRPRAPASD